MLSEQQGKAESGIKRRLSFFLPHYDEIILFAMSVACLLLIADKIIEINWESVSFTSSRSGDPRIIILGLLFLAGLVLSIYHAFSDREKNSLEKFGMLFLQ